MCGHAKSGIVTFMLLCVHITKYVPDESYVQTEAFEVNEVVNLRGHFGKVWAGGMSNYEAIIAMYACGKISLLLK